MDDINIYIYIYIYIYIILQDLLELKIVDINYLILFHYYICIIKYLFIFSKFNCCRECRRMWKLVLMFGLKILK